jgi:hypothetical protein
MSTTFPTTTSAKCKVIHRENQNGRFTSFAHWAKDGSPAASSFPGWLSVEECKRIVSINRERTET